MTFTVDWALKSNYLSIFSPLTQLKTPDSHCFHFQPIDLKFWLCETEMMSQSTQQWILLWSGQVCVWLGWTELGFYGRVMNAVLGLKELKRTLCIGDLIILSSLDFCFLHELVLKWLHYTCTCIYIYIYIYIYISAEYTCTGSFSKIFID